MHCTRHGRAGWKAWPGSPSGERRRNYLHVCRANGPVRRKRGEARRDSVSMWFSKDPHWLGESQPGLMTCWPPLIGWRRDERSIEPGSQSGTHHPADNPTPDQSRGARVSLVTSRDVRSLHSQPLQVDRITCNVLRPKRNKQPAHTTTHTEQRSASQPGPASSLV